MGGLRFTDEAYCRYRPESERGFGQGSIEILLQVMENQRDDLAVILAGYKNRIDTFLGSNLGLALRIAHPMDFPDHSHVKLMQVAQLMLCALSYRFDGRAAPTFTRYAGLRRQRPSFANARSIRNALGRIRLRHPTRLFASHMVPTREDLLTLQADDIHANRVFGIQTPQET